MEQIGRFKVLRRLGGGGFGEVWLGRDEMIARDVAIKVFNPRDENLIAFATSTDTEALSVLRTRFINEARILGGLESNLHIINVLDFGELDDGCPYYVMPYLPESLSNKLGRDVFDAAAIEELPESERPRALGLSDSLRYLAQIATGLAAAHDQGLVHRDIKPSNIMLSSDDEIRLVDFGIAKAPDGQHSTVSQLGMGSRNYMAPEQRESAKHVDARADVYAVGVVAYRMTTGRLPVGRFVDPNVLVPEMNQALSDLIVNCLAVEKDERVSDASALLRRLNQAMQQQGAVSESTGTWIAGSEQALRDDLKPLKSRIEKLLHNHSFVAESEMPGLQAMARIADLDEDGLSALIRAVEEEQTTTLKPVRNFLALVDEQIASDTVDLNALALAGEAISWDRARIENYVAQQTTTAKPSPGGPRKDLRGLIRLLATAATAATVVAVLAGGYWLFQTWQEGVQIEQGLAAEQEKSRLEKQEKEDTAWGEAESADTIAAYQAYLDGEVVTQEYIQQAQARMTELAAQSKDRQDSIRRAALREALTLGTVPSYQAYLDSGLATQKDKDWFSEAIKNAAQESVDPDEDRQQMKSTAAVWLQARQKNTVAGYQQLANNTELPEEVRALARTQLAAMAGDSARILEAIKAAPGQ